MSPRHRAPGYRFAVRNRYLDLLRAAAIVRVIVYHLFGWPWLSIVLPAMGVMFALAGSLTAASLDRRGAREVVTSRLRRLLPPLWLLALLAVPVMLVLGWAHEDGEIPYSPAKLLLWILPIGDPPGSDKGVDAWEPLWYIRAYLWFVILSPTMYLAYKKTGWVAVGAPIVLIAVLDKTGFSLPDLADAAMWDFVTFAACWMTGFAHHDGRLARTRPWVVIGAALTLGAAAMYWLKGHPGPDGYDLNDVTESQALWSLAFVLLALRWEPSMAWLARLRPLDRAVTLLNGRAVTIYLWHNIAIAAIWPVLAVVALDDLGRLDPVVDLTTALLLTGVAVLAFGWAEDLAARRRPRLWPTVNTPHLNPADADADAAPDPAGPGTARHSATPGRRSRADHGMPLQRAGAAAALQHASTAMPPRSARATAAINETTQVQPALDTPIAGMTADRPVVQFGLPPTVVQFGPPAPDGVPAAGAVDGRVARPGTIAWELEPGMAIQARPEGGWAAELESGEAVRARTPEESPAARPEARAGGHGPPEPHADGHRPPEPHADGHRPPEPRAGGQARPPHVERAGGAEDEGMPRTGRPAPTAGGRGAAPWFGGDPERH
jgi:peptidoglycan/LPS O-acetylase OafA/YrhL